MFVKPLRQSGSGLLPYAGVRYQKGNGFFGNLMKKAIFPFLRYAGMKGLDKFTEFAQAAVQNPDGVKDIAKQKLLEMAGDALADGGKRAKKFIQTGEGMPKPIKVTKFKPVVPLPPKKRQKTNKGNRKPTKKPRNQSMFIHKLFNQN
jgi:hypothetical protein